MITVGIVNHSTALTDAQVKAIVPALQTQVSRDFFPVWGVNATINFVSKNAKINPAWWQLVIFDTSDQAGALGYHELTNDGHPLGKVFAKDDIDNGYNWTVTVSHELLEMLGDPDANLGTVIQDDSGATKVYCYEVCDACEDEQYAYAIGSTKVSDFVYPTWWETSTSAPGIKYDHMGHITAPLQLLSGGYIGVFNVAADSPGWNQLSAQRAAQHPDGVITVNGDASKPSKVKSAQHSRLARRKVNLINRKKSEHHHHHEEERSPKEAHHQIEHHQAEHERAPEVKEQKEETTV